MTYIDDIDGHPTREIESVVKALFREPCIDKDSRIVIIPTQFEDSFRHRAFGLWATTYPKEFAEAFTDIDTTSFDERFSALIKKVGKEMAILWLSHIGEKQSAGLIQRLSSISIEDFLRVIRIPFTRVLKTQDSYMIYY